MEKRVKLLPYGTHLWGKAKARQVKSALNQILESLQPGDVLAIDHAGVEAFDLTFATELFGKLIGLVASAYGGRFVIVENLNECTSENLSVALERLNLAVIVREGKRLWLLGKVNSSDTDTFAECVAAGGTISATLLSSRLEITSTAMNERLAKLTALGVVRRERGSSASGRTQYEYRVLN
jgi:hypothetical protein